MDIDLLLQYLFQEPLMIKILFYTFIPCHKVKKHKLGLIVLILPLNISLNLVTLETSIHLNPIDVIVSPLNQWKLNYNYY